MSRAACTVNVVTTDGLAGKYGVTVSAMTSVSADSPRPTLLFCVHHLSPAAQAFEKNGVFCANILCEDQKLISDCFAGRLGDHSRISFPARLDSSGQRCSCLDDAFVAFDCVVTSSACVGTHHVIIGEVTDVHNVTDGTPLIYVNRGYGRPTTVVN